MNDEHGTAGEAGEPRTIDYEVSLWDNEQRTTDQAKDYPRDDTECWLCGAPTLYRRCKIICTVCHFTRDCSDP